MSLLFLAMALSAIGAVVAKTASKYSVGQSYAIPIALIGWLPEMNAAREKQPLLHADATKTGTKPGVFESLVSRGWSSELPAQAIVATADQVKQLLHYRKAAIEAYIAEGRNDLANICREMWADKNGKLLEPVFVGNSGFTRGLSLPEVVLAKAIKATSEGDSTFTAASFTVQVVVKEFATEDARVIEQVFENESRNMVGVTNMGWPDLLKGGRAILAAAGNRANEAMLRRAFGKVGTAQKVFAILTADGRFPSLRLVERICMDKPENFDKGVDYSATGYIPVTAIPQQAGGLKNAPDAEAAEAWLKKEVFSEGNAAKVTAKPVWEGLAASFKMEDGSPMHAIAKAHLDGIGFAGIADKYPQLFKASCVLSLAAKGQETAAPAVKATPTKVGKGK